MSFWLLFSVLLSIKHSVPFLSVSFVKACASCCIAELGSVSTAVTPYSEPYCSYWTAVKLFGLILNLQQEQAKCGEAHHVLLLLGLIFVLVLNKPNEFHKALYHSYLHVNTFYK